MSSMGFYSHWTWDLWESMAHWVCSALCLPLCLPPREMLPSSWYSGVPEKQRWKEEGERKERAERKWKEGISEEISRQINFMVFRDWSSQRDWQWGGSPPPVSICCHTDLFPGVDPDGCRAWEARRSCSSVSLALVTGSLVSRVEDNNCQMVLL